MFNGMLTQAQPDEDEQPGLDTKKVQDVSDSFVSRDEGIQRQSGTYEGLRQFLEGHWTDKAEGVRIDYLQRFSVICRHRKTFQWGRHAANKTKKENVAKYNEEVGLHPVREKVQKEDRLAISISEEELKKGIEEDEADGCVAEVDDDLADQRDSLSDCLCSF